jgi:hypothetical protein
MATLSFPLCMNIVGYDHQADEERRFDVVSEALAWGRQQAAAMITRRGLTGPIEETCNDGVLFMGQVMNEAGEAVDTEPLVWVGIEVLPGVHTRQS